MSCRLLIWLVFAFIAGCGGEHDESGTGPNMRPGENCLRCHGFRVAGTLFAKVDAAAAEGLSGGSVELTDAKGVTVKLISNAVGNFYAADNLTFPLTASVTKDGVTKTMQSPVTSGGCSGCHAAPPANGAPGRLYLGSP